MIRMILLQLSNPPGRMIPARLHIIGQHLPQGLALARIASQTGIDQRRQRPRPRPLLGRLDQLAHQRVLRVHRRLLRQQTQPQTQHRIHRRIRGLGHQKRAQRPSPPPMPQRRQQQRLHPGAQSRRALPQPLRARLPRRHRLQTPRRPAQLQPQLRRRHTAPQPSRTRHSKPNSNIIRY